MTTQIVPGVRMRGNLKSVPEEPQYVEAKLSCTEFQEAKKLLFQVKTFVTSVSWPFMYQAGRLPDEHVFKGGLGLYETDYFQAFKKAELGAWVEKPMEQDEFETKTE